MFKTISRNTFVLFALSFSLSSTDLYSQASTDKQAEKKRTYKKARVLQASTAKKIVKIVEALERQKTINVPDPLNKGQFIEKEEDDPLMSLLLNQRKEEEDEWMPRLMPRSFLMT